MSELIGRKIAAAKVQFKGVAAGHGLARGVTWFALILLGGILLDWFCDLSWLTRVVLLAGNLGVAGYALFRYGLQPLIWGPDDEDIALQVEHLEPAFATRLIAAVQFGRAEELESQRSGGAVGLVRAMVAQTEQLAAGVDFGRVVRWESLIRYAVAAGVLFLVLAGFYTVGGPTAQILMQRAFLMTMRLPSKTSVEMLSGSMLVARGENVVLKARAKGWLPRLGTAEIRWESGRTQRVEMDSSKDEADVFAVAVEGVPESFHYRVRLNDGVSDDFNVRVEVRPAVTGLTCTQIYPKYTGLPDQERPPSELSILQGSKLRLAIQTNHAVRVGSVGTGQISRVQMVARDGTPAIPPVALAAVERGEDGRRQLRAEITPPDHATGFTIELVDDHDIPSGDAVFYPIELLPDRPPTVRILAPERKDTLVTVDTKLNLVYLAEDDYRLGKISLRYRMDGGSEQKVGLPLEAGKKSWQGVYTWQINQIPLPAGKTNLEQSVIEYFLEAQDTNPLNGPGRGVSEHYTLHVVTKAQKQAELLVRMSSSIAGIRDVSDNQEKAAQGLGEAIVEPPPPRKGP